MPRAKTIESKKKGAVEFNVSPWISTSDRKEGEVHGEHDVKFVNLIAQAQGTGQKCMSHAANKMMPVGSASPWVTCTRPPSNSNQPPSTSTSSVPESSAAATPRPSAPENVEDNGNNEDFDILESPSHFTIEGRAHLILLPTGSLSGQIILEGHTSSLPLIGRVISKGVKACEFDQSSSILRVTLMSPEGPGSGEDLVCHVTQTGGDLATLSPAESWQLRECGVEVDGDESAAGVSLFFSPEVLLEGEAAEESIRAINRKLVGKEGLVVLRGEIRLENMPSGFLHHTAANGIISKGSF